MNERKRNKRYSIRSKMVVAFGAALLTASGAWTGCKTFKVKTPSGFVKYKRTSNYYRAVSPDNAVIVARSWKNKKKGSLGFWVETVKRDFVKVRGYKHVKTEETRSKKGTKGKRMWFESSYRGRMFSYQISLFVTKKRIFALETMVEKEALKQHMNSFKKAAASLELL